jgi:uncharacterized membrane protein YgdD (TMEM256/DUF423 family)
MKNPFLTLAAFFGATGVAMGAMGAHFIREKMKSGLLDQFQYDAWSKAAVYQLFHSIVLLFVFFFYQQTNARLVKISGWLFTVGILFFSGSVYLLSTQPLTQISFGFLGPITPLGGLCFITGWILLLVQSVKHSAVK